ncbi:MAG: hypothetical protein AM1032_000391 [Mycoplasmataceae bacterium]|nr:MAG: hypothetical protein AM1032_000391 [Mycoplasmataceae bacterium]
MQAEYLTDNQKKLIAIFTILVFIGILIGTYYLLRHLITKIKKFWNRKNDKYFMGD